MKRKQTLKSIKAISLSIIASGLFAACNPQEVKTEEVRTEDTSKEVVIEEELSERDKLIINREQMRFADAENPTDFELKHTPEITLGESNDLGFTEVKILLGQKGIIHPTEDNHWIDFITLYTDDQQVGHIEFDLNSSAMGYSQFYVKLDGVKALKAVAGCNLHGIWESVLTL